MPAPLLYKLLLPLAEQLFSICPCSANILFFRSETAIRVRIFPLINVSAINIFAFHVLLFPDNCWILLFKFKTSVTRFVCCSSSLYFSYRPSMNKTLIYVFRLVTLQISPTLHSHTLLAIIIFIPAVIPFQCTFY